MGKTYHSEKAKYMKTIQINHKESGISNGETIRLVYDEEGDMLDIFFGENEPATGIELTDNILLRVNRAAKRAVSLTILHFSIMAERTEFGTRSYPLSNLKTLPVDLQEIVMNAIITAPVSQFLRVSYFQASQKKRMPFASVEPLRFAYAA